MKETMKKFFNTLLDILSEKHFRKTVANMTIAEAMDTDYDSDWDEEEFHERDGRIWQVRWAVFEDLESHQCHSSFATRREASNFIKTLPYCARALPIMVEWTNWLALLEKEGC